MSKRILLGIIVVLVLGLVSCQGQSGSADPPMQTVVVTRGNLNAMVNAAGNIAAHTSSALSFQTSGQVKEIFVQIGDHVKAGQKLAQLDTTDLEMALTNAQLSLGTARTKLEQTQAGPDPSDVADARASLANAQSAYNAALAKYKLGGDQQTVARAQLDRAKNALDRAKFAYEWAKNDWLARPATLDAKKQAVDDAQSAYDDALRAYNSSLTGINDSGVRSAAAQVASAVSQLDSLENTPTSEDIVIGKAQVTQAELAVKQAQLNLDRATLVAPFDGIVTDVAVQVGQTFVAGAGAISLADLSRLEITVNLAEVDAPKVQVGQPVTITVDALNGRELSGRVAEIGLVGQTTQNVVIYPSVIQLTSNDPDVRSGMNASVGIVIAQRNNVLRVPNRTIHTVGRQRTVAVYYHGEMITLPVRVGLAGDTYTEITQGVNEGDELALNAPAATTSGVAGFGFGIGRMFGGGR